MKFLLLSDIHATSKTPVSRNDDILEAFKRKFTFILEYAEKHEATILQAGDLFNSSRDWHVLSLMIDLLKKHNVPIFTVYGQHDMYYRANIISTPTTLNILNNLNLLKILSPEEPTIFNKNIYVYGCSWKYGESDKTAIPMPEGKVNILVVHSPVTQKGLFPKQEFIPTKFFETRNKWDLILCGDIHIKEIYEREMTIIANTGPILRLHGNKYNLRHRPCFFIYDTVKKEMEEFEIPHQKAKRVITRDHIKTPAKIISTTSFEELTKLLKEKTEPIAINKILMAIMKKEGTPDETKRYLNKIMGKV